MREGLHAMQKWSILFLCLGVAMMLCFSGCRIMKRMREDYTKSRLWEMLLLIYRGKYDMIATALNVYNEHVYIAEFLGGEISRPSFYHSIVTFLDENQG